MGSDEPMTSERLAEIQARVAGDDEPTLYWNGMGGALEQAENDRAALLAEVERLRAALDVREAREAALVAHVNEALTDIAQSVLESGGLPPEQFPLDHARVTVVSLEQRLTQMRWLLASEQKGGGDGQR